MLQPLSQYYLSQFILLYLYIVHMLFRHPCYKQCIRCMPHTNCFRPTSHFPPFPVCWLTDKAISKTNIKENVCPLWNPWMLQPIFPALHKATALSNLHHTIYASKSSSTKISYLTRDLLNTATAEASPLHANIHTFIKHKINLGLLSFFLPWAARIQGPHWRVTIELTRMKQHYI